MSGPLRPCGRAECRLCNPRPLHDEPRDGFGWGVLLLVLVGVLFLFVLPALRA